MDAQSFAKAELRSLWVHWMCSPVDCAHREGRLSSWRMVRALPLLPSLVFRYSHLTSRKRYKRYVQVSLLAYTLEVLSLKFAVLTVIGCSILPAGQEVCHGAEHQECSGETDSCSAAANQFTGNSPPVVAAVHHFLLLSVDCVCPLDGTPVNGPGWCAVSAADGKH